MKTKRSKRLREGFSLTELVAAMTIFSVGVMACVELYSVSLRSASDSLDYTQAVFLAQRILEDTLAEGALTASIDSGDFGEAYPRHSYEMEIEDADQDGLMLVHVTVMWTARNVEKQYELTTLYADREVLEASL
ncbi:MAG: prepilin-type N-terminal cleavage/methylation domain-containing protein [Candidatus Hydrogenedentes bacterium]|nr:prepilin-type N-terminal cleavage/methylation domain-containing protein [Candidatus Hydrogenedentota bacterium]